METLESQIRSVLDRNEQGGKLDWTLQQVQEDEVCRLQHIITATKKLCSESPSVNFF